MQITGDHSNLLIIKAVFGASPYSSLQPISPSDCQQPPATTQGIYIFLEATSGFQQVADQSLGLWP